MGKGKSKACKAWEKAERKLRKANRRLDRARDAHWKAEGAVQEAWEVRDAEVKASDKEADDDAAK